MAAVTESPNQPPTTSRGGARSLTKTERRNLRLGLLFISPWIFGFLAFLVYPIYYTVRISFTRYSGFGEPEWIGLATTSRCSTTTSSGPPLYNTLYYTLLAVPIGVVVAMVLALAMNQPLPEVAIYRRRSSTSRRSRFSRSAVRLSSSLSTRRGIFNQFLARSGFPTINWFGDPPTPSSRLVILAQFGAGAGRDHLPGRAQGHPAHPLRGGRARRGRRLAAGSANHAAA